MCRNSSTTHTKKALLYILTIQVDSILDLLRDPVHFLSAWFCMGMAAPWDVRGINLIMITYWAFLLKYAHPAEERPLFLIKNAYGESLLMQSCKLQHSGALCHTQQRFARTDKSGFCRAVIQQKSPLSHINDCSCNLFWKSHSVGESWGRMTGEEYDWSTSFASADGNWQSHWLLVISDRSQWFQGVHFLWWKKTCLLAKRKARRGNRAHHYETSEEGTHVWTLNNSVTYIHTFITIENIEFLHQTTTKKRPLAASVSAHTCDVSHGNCYGV